MLTLQAHACDEEFRKAMESRTPLETMQVFDHAVNFLLGSSVYSLVSHRSYAAPCTATVEDGFSFRSHPIVAGCTAVWERGDLVLAPSLRVGFSACEISDVRCSALPWSSEKAIAGLSAFDEHLVSWDFDCGCLAGYRIRRFKESRQMDPMTACVEWRAMRLLRTAMQGDAVGGAVRGLVGAGIGLTPSGDDYIDGFLCMLGSIDHPDAAAVRARIVKDLLEPGVLQATTAVSRQMLICKCAFRSALPHLRLVNALLRDAQDMRPALSELLAIGHTSGADFASGAASALWEFVSNH